MNGCWNGFYYNDPENNPDGEWLSLYVTIPRAGGLPGYRMHPFGFQKIASFDVDIVHPSDGGKTIHLNGAKSPFATDKKAWASRG